MLRFINNSKQYNTFWEQFQSSNIRLVNEIVRNLDAHSVLNL